MISLQKTIKDINNLAKVQSKPYTIQTIRRISAFS